MTTKTKSPRKSTRKLKKVIAVRHGEYGWEGLNDLGKEQMVKLAEKLAQLVGKTKKIALLTNNPDKATQMGNNGITVVDRVAIETMPNKINKSYLRIKKHKLGHTLHNV